LTMFARATRLLDLHPRLRFLWPLPIAAASLALGWGITAPTAGGFPLQHGLLVLGFAAPLVVLGWLTRRAHLRLLAGVSLADGFSPVAWGGDCDDLDPSHHPLVLDDPGGGDVNCNGVDPPRRPTDADRGVAPPRGDPDLPAGTVDLALLITIDCWRADALVP